MPTVIQPIRSDNAYFGLAKETTPGTAVAPTTFPRWYDGSQLEYDLKSEELWEGDGTRRLAQLVKNRQSVKIKLKCSPRSVEMGVLESATMGTGSDAITTSTPSTTSTGAVTGGTSTTVGLTSGTGFTGAGGGTYILLVGTGTAADPYEAVTFVMPASGTTLTVAAAYNGGKFKQNHPSGTTIAAIDPIDTSFTSAASAGATTIVVGNNVGLTGSGTALVVLSPGTANEEIATITTPGTGTGPYTYTLSASATLKKAHSVGDAMYGVITHVLTDQYDGDYYTVEVGLGSLNGAAGMTLRVRDCKVNTCKVTGKAGGVLMYEMEFEGIACAVQGSPATVTLEQHPVFLYTQGVWTLDGSSASNDAISIDSFSIDRKNNLDNSIQTEQLTLAALIFGNLMVDLAFDVVYTNANLFNKTYFGSTTGTGDSQTIGAGSWAVTFTQADGFQSVTYTIPTTHYSKVGAPVPKKDGKHYKQSVSAAGVSNAGVNAYIMQTSLNNMQASTY
jgi:hypothetical protein